jgi:hypothetical protein
MSERESLQSPAYACPLSLIRPSALNNEADMLEIVGLEQEKRRHK